MSTRWFQRILIISNGLHAGLHPAWQPRNTKTSATRMQTPPSAIHNSGISVMRSLGATCTDGSHADLNTGDHHSQKDGVRSQAVVIMMLEKDSCTRQTTVGHPRRLIPFRACRKDRVSARFILLAMDKWVRYRGQRKGRDSTANSCAALNTGSRRYHGFSWTSL